MTVSPEAALMLPSGRVKMTLSYFSTCSQNCIPWERSTPRACFQIDTNRQDFVELRFLRCQLTHSGWPQWVQCRDTGQNNKYSNREGKPNVDSTRFCSLLN